MADLIVAVILKNKIEQDYQLNVLDANFFGI